MPDQHPMDLRNTAGWQKWIDQLPTELHDLAHKAGMLYLEAEDSLLLVFPGSAHGAFDLSAVEDLIDEVKSYYDDRRSSWLETVTGEILGTDVPKDLIMPRIVIELGSPTKWSH
jgi:hypothetical protein